MKQLLFLTLFFGLLCIAGCEAQDPPSPVEVDEITKADAAGALETISNLQELGFTPTHAYAPVYFFYVAMGSAAASDMAGNNQNRLAYNNLKDSVTRLNSKYLLNTNPYEAIGIAHNQNLKVFSDLGRPVTASDIQNDGLILKFINNTGTFTTTEQQQMLSEIKTLQANKQIFEKFIANARYIVSIKADITKLSFQSSYVINYLTAFLSEIDAMAKGGDYKDRLYSKINKAIDELLAGENSSNSSIIIFLTVYKHSFEFWH